jgi:hypothetical protein
MRVASSFMPEDENNIYKKAVYKLKPELEGREIEADCLQELVCSQCGQEGGSALVYRLNEKDSWERAITFNCSECRDREVLNLSMEKDLKEQRQFISERLINAYFLLPEKLYGFGLHVLCCQDPLSFTLLVNCYSCYLGSNAYDHYLEHL